MKIINKPCFFGFFTNFILYLLLLLLLFMSACDKSNYVTFNDKYYNFEKFYPHVTSWPYSIDEKKIKSAISNYKKLNIGVKDDYVKKFFGNPDIIDSVHEYRSKKKYITSWLYIFKLEKPLTENGSMLQGIAFYFNTSGELYAALPIKIKYLNPLGSIHDTDIDRYILYDIPNEFKTRE